jgi:hypothetical protein
MQIDIPLLCAEPQAEARNVFWLRFRAPLTHLDLLALAMSPDTYIGQSSASYVPHPGQTVALATLIDYAVATYGRERLPALVAGLGRYDSWGNLIPVVYGISASEFERGWQAYLAARYGVFLDTITH